MAQRVKVLLPLLAVGALLFMPGDAATQVSSRTTGITLRGAARGWPDSRERLVWLGGAEHTYFDSEGVGGWISFFSRATDELFLEISFGGLVRSVEEVKWAEGTETYVEALVPVLLGARAYPFEPSRHKSLRPYLSFGAGPYWMTDIESVETLSRDDFSVDARHAFGGYLGAGVDFMLTDWLGLNVDFRQHYVDFRRSHEYSGSEYAVGMQFMWGNRRPHGRRGGHR